MSDPQIAHVVALAMIAIGFFGAGFSLGWRVGRRDERKFNERISAIRQKVGIK